MPTPFSVQSALTPDGRAAVFEVAGKLDTTTVEELHPRVQEVYQTGVRRFVFDLAALEFTGSLGVRLLLALQTQLKGTGLMVLCAPRPAVRGMFEMMRLTEVLPVYATRDEALAAVMQPL